MSGLQRGKWMSNRSNVVYDVSLAQRGGPIYEDRAEVYGAMQRPAQQISNTAGGLAGTKPEGDVYETVEERPFSSYVRSSSQVDLLDEEETPGERASQDPISATTAESGGPPARPPPPQQHHQPPPRPAQPPLAIAKKPVGDNDGSAVKTATISIRELNYVPVSVYVLAIVSTLFFFLPLGVLSLIKAFQARKLVSMGAYEQALVASQDAKGLAYLAIAVGLFTFGILALWRAGICASVDKLCL